MEPCSATRPGGGRCPEQAADWTAYCSISGLLPITTASAAVFDTCGGGVSNPILGSLLASVLTLA